MTSGFYSQISLEHYISNLLDVVSTTQCMACSDPVVIIKKISDSSKVPDKVSLNKTYYLTDKMGRIKLKKKQRLPNKWKLFNYWRRSVDRYMKIGVT